MANKINFTKTALDALPLPDAGKRTDHWDTKVQGLLVRVTVLNITRMANGPIALLFGGMLVARTLMPTGIFDWIGTHFLILTRGSGKRFLLGLIVLVAPLCAILPNATTVILLAPVIIRVARRWKWIS